MNKDNWKELDEVLADGVEGQKDGIEIDIELDEEVEGFQEETKAEKKTQPDEDSSSAKRYKKQQAALKAAADELAEENKRLKESLQKQQKANRKKDIDLYKSTAEDLGQTIKTLQDSLKQAFASSDFDNAVEINSKLQRALLKHEAYKAVAEEKDEDEDQEDEIVPEKKQVQRKAPIPPALEDWLDENEWFDQGQGNPNADKKKTRIAVRLSDELLKEGYSTDEDDFYEELDKRLKATVKTEQKPTPNTQPQKGNSSVVRKDGKIFVKYDQTDIDFAKRMGLYDTKRPELFKSYLANKAKVEKASSNFVDID